jgi:SHS family lactate transporter-like MFS transporter
LAGTPGVISTPAVGRRTTVLPWWREVTRDQWRAFFAVFLGWVVDSFDFNVLAFILIDIQKHFTVDKALAGALGTVTLMMRLIGGTMAGAAADRWGRKLPLMVSVLWFSIFAFLSGFSTTYAMLFGLRALFGLGMGGEWAAGMPLVLEHWPTKLRGLASGLMLGGWYWGYLLSAAVFQYVYPMFATDSSLAWRAMFWICIIPALFTLWIRRKVPESPVWLARQRAISDAARAGRPMADSKGSVLRIFQPDLFWTTMQTTLVIGSFMCIYYSVNFWYPTFLREGHRETLPYLALFNIAAIIGTAVWGRLSETRLGRRGAVTVTVILGLVSLRFYLYSTDTMMLMVGAAMMGAFGMGVWGMAPAYTVERYPTETRGVGPGFCYHAGAAIGATMPTLLGFLQDRGFAMVNAMSAAMVVSALVALAAIWSGPETRGKAFD